MQVMIARFSPRESGDKHRSLANRKSGMRINDQIASTQAKVTNAGTSPMPPALIPPRPPTPVVVGHPSGLQEELGQYTLGLAPPSLLCAPPNPSCVPAPKDTAIKTSSRQGVVC